MSSVVNLVEWLISKSEFNPKISEERRRHLIQKLGQIIQHSNKPVKPMIRVPWSHSGRNGDAAS